MESFLTYLWKSALILFLFHGIYFFLLRKETFFQSIRVFLFLGILTSFLLPLLSIPVYTYVETPEIPFAIATQHTDQNVSGAFSFNWIWIIPSIYLSVAFVLFIRFCAQIINLLKLIFTHRVVKENNFKLIETTKSTSPFSFLNYIVYNPDSFSKEELRQILIHEKVHARQWHTIDTLLANFLTVFQWFNPIAWIYKYEIEKNLEYIADESAKNHQITDHRYEHLLIKALVPDYQMALANNFYNSLLKKRIIMLHAKRSNGKSQIKLLLIVPLLLAFMFTLNTRVIAQNKEKQQKTIKVKIEKYVRVFTKETTKNDLDELVKSFGEKGLTVKFTGIKRNKKDEITSIHVDAKLKNGKASASYASENEKGINPVQISVDSGNNSINIGSANDDLHFSSADGKKWVVKGSDKHTVFVSKNNDDATVWVTSDGDTTKVKSKKMIFKSNEDTDGEHAETYEITIDTDDNADKDQKEIKKEVVVVTGKGEGNDHNFVFMSDDEASPLFIIDGVKTTQSNLDKLDPDKIESINVLKGDAATRQYGDEGKNGVVLITTKKK